MFKLSTWTRTELYSGQQPVSLPRSAKCRALLRYLAVQGQPASRAELIELLFSNADSPRAALRWALSQLRACAPAGQLLDTSDPQQVGLHPDVVSDVAELRAWVQTNNAGGQPREIEDAHAFYLSLQSPPLNEHSLRDCAQFDIWRYSQQGQLSDTYAKLQALLLSHIEDTDRRVEIARARLRVDPNSEAAWAILVEQLSQAGRTAEAARTRLQAIEQLAQAGLPIPGQLGTTAQPTPAVAMPVSPGGPASPEFRTCEKTRLAVTQCRVEGARLHSLAGRLHDALYTAANANRCCVLLAQGVTASIDAHSEAAKEVRADLLLDSSLEQRGSDWHLKIELISAADDVCLYRWEGTYEQRDAEALAGQLVQHYSARFEIDIQMALIVWAHQKAEHQRTLNDSYYMALPRIYSPEGHDPASAVASLQEIIDIDPGFGPALGIIAWVRTTHAEFNQHPDDLALTSRLARRAAGLCQDDTFVCALSAIVIATVERDLDTARDTIERALSFNPYSTMGLCALAIVEHYCGRQTQALKILERAETAIDTEPLTFVIFSFRALALYLCGRGAEGLTWALKATGRNPSFVVGQRALVLCLAGSDAWDEAREQAVVLQQGDASEHLDYFAARSPYAKDEDRNKILADLARAGVRQSSPEAG
ncbi:MAG: hypothetical protein AAF529_18050 [Pseudomonadota bacterium]